MPLLQTTTLSNQDIHAAFLAGTYTADIDRSSLKVSLMADQVAGGGNYTAYITRQLAGGGSAYEGQPRQVSPVATGVTAVLFESDAFSVKATDVVKVYIIGLAGDTTTPDITCEFWDTDGLKPTVAGRTLDVAATGEGGLRLRQYSPGSQPDHADQYHGSERDHHRNGLGPDRLRSSGQR